MDNDLVLNFLSEFYFTILVIRSEEHQALAAFPVGVGGSVNEGGGPKSRSATPKT